MLEVQMGVVQLVGEWQYISVLHAVCYPVRVEWHVRVHVLPVCDCLRH